MAKKVAVIETVEISTPGGKSSGPIPLRDFEKLPAKMRADSRRRGSMSYRAPAWLRGLRHVAAKDKDLFTFHAIWWRCKDGGDFDAAASDGHNLLYVSGNSPDWDVTPVDGLLLPVEIFAKCKAELDSGIDIEYPDFDPEKKNVAMVTASWMQPQSGKDLDGNELPPLPMSAGIGSMYGAWPDQIAECLSSPRGTYATGAVFSLETARQVYETIKDIAAQPRYTIRAAVPDGDSLCDVLFPPAAGLHDCEIRFLVKPAGGADAYDWLK